MLSLACDLLEQLSQALVQLPSTFSTAFGSLAEHCASNLPQSAMNGLPREPTSSSASVVARIETEMQTFCST
ncbi:MAG TPA: hypothetical protein PLD73_01875, partial [Candidatus Hydrogenedentes bacterium]|nr:hypothetical protein [Candidatus Hydrogenedentota bacterium]